VPPLAAVPDLDRELDALYGLPLDEWTKARNDLASRLRRAHQDDAAEAVRKLRKPSVAAWAVNRLARVEPKGVEALLDAGERLRAAQERAVRGHAGAADVSAAARAEREAVRGLVAAARGLLEEAGRPASQPLLDRISQTLRAAAVDESSRDLLAHGRLEAEVEAVGFGSLTAVEPLARPRAGAREQARERAKALRAEARRLEREAREADAEARLAEREADAARATADDARRRADEARVAADRGADAVEQAEAEVERLKR
jgi:hypothetical protein